MLRQDESRAARAGARSAAGPRRELRRRAATSRSPTRSSATGRSTSCSCTAGCAASSRAGSGPQIAALLRAARRHGPAHPVRQARHRPVGPRRRDRPARGAHGRRARGDRRRRLRARGDARRDEGGPMSALFAATYPERTAAPRGRWASFARRLPGPDYPHRRPAAVRSPPEEWGVPAARRFLAERAPTVADDEEAIRWYASYLVRGASPGAAAQITRMNQEIDVRHVLPTIQAPSLVLYRAEEYLREATRYMGTLHAGRARARAARAGPPAVGGRPGGRAARDRGASRHGRGRGRARPGPRDRAARPRPRHAGAAAARACRPLPRDRDPGGRRCSARDVRRARARDPLRAARSSPTPARWASRHRPGCTPASARSHGDVLTGVPVQLADGVASVATAGEVLVSSTVRDLVAGSGMEFTERGTVRLPVARRPAEWRLYEAVTGAITAAVTGRLARSNRPPVHSGLQPTARRPQMQVTETIRNGVDTEQLFGTLDAVKAQPELARVHVPRHATSGSTARTTAPRSRTSTAPARRTPRAARRSPLDAGEPAILSAPTPARTRPSTCCTRSPPA